VPCLNESDEADETKPWLKMVIRELHSELLRAEVDNCFSAEQQECKKDRGVSYHLILAIFIPLSAHQTSVSVCKIIHECLVRFVASLKRL
jgi:hypothetical protein